MSSNNKKIHISQLCNEVSKIVYENRHLGKSVCKKKVANINLGGGSKVGTGTADKIISKYDKYIKI